MTKINEKGLPQHIAIVPDGNRRWAGEKGLKPWRGHFKGAENTQDLLKTSLDLGIRYLSFWGGSLDNLTKRPKKEVSFLFKIYERYFKKLLKDKEVHQNKVKVNVFGRWEEVLPKRLIKTIQELIKKTENYNNHVLNIFLAYSGTDEMIDAVKNIVRDNRGKEIKVTADLIKKNLWTSNLPSVDFLIRTGSNGDPHNSAGFMMWHCADTQFYFSKELYPNFDKNKFVKAIKDFQRRQRRFGA